ARSPLHRQPAERLESLLPSWQRRRSSTRLPGSRCLLDTRSNPGKGNAMMDATGTGLEERVAELTRQISGSVLGRTDADYDTVRAVYNGLIDRKPALIARCLTTQDAVAALAFARREGFEVSVRGAGHNVAGRAVTEGGVMIDLSEMKGIAVDPDRAIATAQG